MGVWVCVCMHVCVRVCVSMSVCVHKVIIEIAVCSGCGIVLLVLYTALLSVDSV